METDLIQEILDKQQENGAWLMDTDKMAWNHLRNWLALEAYFGPHPWGNEAAGTQLGRIGAYENLLGQMQKFELAEEGARELGNVLTSDIMTASYFDSQCGAVLLFSRLVDDQTVLSDGTILGERAQKEIDGLVKTLRFLASDDCSNSALQYELNDPRQIAFYISAMVAAGQQDEVLNSHILDRIRNSRKADGSYYSGGGAVSLANSTNSAMLMALSDLTKGQAALAELCFTGGGVSDAEAVRSDLARITLPEEAEADITLPESGVYGSAFSWESDKPEVIDLTGKVWRPALGQSDVLVKLSVTAKKGQDQDSAQFLVKVPAQEESQLADLRSDLRAVAVPLFTASSIDLPTKGAKGSAFSWTSDQENILSKAGQVQLPEEETLVTLTVQATLGEHQMSQSYTVLVGKAHAETDSVTKGTYAVRERLNTYRAMSSSYWAIFSAKSLLEERFDAYDFQRYNVRNHRTTSQWQCTDYGAVILQLIMQGDNPYNYQGVNYVQELINWINEPGNDGMGGWANPIFAALALRAAAADVSQITNSNNTYEKMVAYCRGRIQPTAANVEYGPDMSGWAMTVLANELDQDNDGHVDDPNNPLLKELEAFFAYLRQTDDDHTWISNGKYAALFEGAKGKAADGYDVTLSAGCIVSGLMALKAAGVEGCDITSDDSAWKVTVGGQKVGIMDTLYKIHFAETAPRYGQIPMEFGDAFYGDSIWRRCAVTPAKLEQLIHEAQTVDRTQYTEASVRALETALAKVQEQSGDLAYGEAYFALQDALKGLMEKQSVTLSIYGDAVHGQILSPLTSHLAGDSAADLLAWAAVKAGIDYQLDEAGKQLLAVEGLAALENQGWWCYQNGTRMDIPLSELSLQEGDQIVFKFCSDLQALQHNETLTEHLLADDWAELALGGAIDGNGRATGDVLLPSAGVFGSAVNWYSDKTFALDESGKVTRDAHEDITVHLEARLSLDGQTKVKNFTVVVAGLGGSSSGGTEVQKKASIFVAGPVGSGWVLFPEQTLTIEAGETAYSLLKKTGLPLVVDESTQYGVYVKAIDGLAEFDEGPDSGWMYRVNGKFPGHSAALARISDGDTVEWLYTRDRGKDIGGYVPESGAAAGSQVVTGMTEKVDANGQAEVILAEQAVNELVESIKNSAAVGGKVEIVTAIPAEAQAVTVQVPAVVVETLSSAKQTTLVVTTDLAAWELDNQMIQTLQKEAGGQALVLCAAQINSSQLTPALQKQIGSRPILELQMKAGNKVISSWQEGVITVRLPYQLQKEEKAEDLVVLHVSEGQAQAVPGAHYEQALGGMVFAANHFSLFAIASQTADAFRFVDVPKGHWARAVIEEMVQKGLLAGRSTDRFAPEEAVTRAEIMVLLARLNGRTLPPVTKAPFADVQPEAWYAPAIAWAVEEGLVHGIDAENFAPNAPVSRQDLAVMLHNYLRHQNAALPTASAVKTFRDEAAIAAYAQESVDLMQQAGMLTGKDGGCFEPYATATRAEAAAVLSRLSGFNNQ